MEDRYNYKDLSKEAKERAYQNTLNYYDYAIEEMLKNSIFDKDGERTESKAMRDILI